MVWFNMEAIPKSDIKSVNMEAIPKFDIKSVIKSDIKFDISIKLTTWIGHKGLKFQFTALQKLRNFS